MEKKYLIFDLDWTLINSMSWLVDLILDYLEDHAEMTREEMYYLFKTTAWTPLEKQMCNIFWCEKKWKEFWKKVYDEILIHNQKNPAQFFKWVPEKIKELSKNYKLFLTTWNHTNFAKEVLEKWWILDLFEEVYWSEIIHKWKEHLIIFQEKMMLENWENNFFEKSVYIWDWDTDRFFAKESGVDFIHIWDEWEDKFEIKSVVEIDWVLEKINRK
jgi:phosphoglycolate phosphatase-like HAD superfamily hydrolase